VPCCSNVTESQSPLYLFVQTAFTNMEKYDRGGEGGTVGYRTEKSRPPTICSMTRAATVRTAEQAKTRVAVLHISILS
jgi:hypothetical protein